MNNFKKQFQYLIVFAICVLLAPSILAQSESEVGWPRQIDLPEGKIVIYQPDMDSFEGNILQGRSAISITLKGETVPIFGAVWFKCRVDTDTDTRMVEFSEIQVPRVRFPESEAEDEKKLAAILEREIPKWDMNISLDRFLAGLDLVEKEQAALENFKHDPPKILVENSPAILIFVDGDPILQEIENSSLQYVANTPFLIVYDKSKKTYYLNGGQIWMEASDIMAPWKQSQRVPSEVKKLTPPEEEAETLGDEDGRMPKIIVSKEPTELIVVDGAPDYKPIEGNNLLYVGNTESDVIMDIISQQHFIMISGRWYASKSLFDGAWSHVPSDKLPEGFTQIPVDSDNGHLLVHVAGTEQAKEAVLEAQIPQTSAIKRDAEGPKVEYDGDPKFENVSGTSKKVEYAVNTGSSVFLVQGQYYCCEEGVWYIAKGASGPWRVCDDVPDEIYTIPPDNPHYNVKYVYVYETTPQVVYVGYYPGYMGSYIYGPTLVYGTGWWYRPWVGHYYYARPFTWGFHVRWNPWYGWSFGFSFGRGPFRFHIGFGGRYGWWGPGRYRPYPYRGGARAAYRAGYRHGYRRGVQQGARAGYRAQTSRNNIYNRQQNVARNAPKTQPANRQKPNVAQGQRNNVYTDRSGNVHRKNDNGQWQSRENGKWSSGQASAKDKSAATRDRSQTKSKTKPSTSSQRSQLNRQSQSRQRGTTRTQQARTPRPNTTRRRR